MIVGEAAVFGWNLDTAGFITAVATIIGLFITLLLTRKELKNGTASRQLEALENLFSYYRSETMGGAIKDLWDFYDRCLDEVNTNNSRMFRTINNMTLSAEVRERARERLRLMVRERVMDEFEYSLYLTDEWLTHIHNPDNRNRIIHNSLNAKRRIVSLFYVHMADIVLPGAFESEVFNEVFRGIDLAIIPEIIMPMDDAVSEWYTEPRDYIIQPLRPVLLGDRRERPYVAHIINSWPTS